MIPTFRSESIAEQIQSNTECIAMDRLTEFLSNLDHEDFRKVQIEGLIKEIAEQSLGDDSENRAEDGTTSGSPQG